MNNEEEQLISEFLTDDYLVKITDESYEIIRKDRNPTLVSLYHISQACIKIIESYNLSEELSVLLKPVLKAQKELLEETEPKEDITSNIHIRLFINHENGKQECLDIFQELLDLQQDFRKEKLDVKYFMKILKDLRDS